MRIFYYAFVRNGLSNIISKETCPVIYPLCWLSFTSNEYFLIVCSIKHWKSQCGEKANANLSLLLCKHWIKISWNRICRSFKAAEPTLRATVHGRVEVAIQLDCFEERFCFWWTFGPLSLVAMFRYIGFPQTTHGKHIGQKKTCWNKKNKKKQGTLEGP